MHCRPVSVVFSPSVGPATRSRVECASGLSTTDKKMRLSSESDSQTRPSAECICELARPMHKRYLHSVVAQTRCYHQTFVMLTKTLMDVAGRSKALNFDDRRSTASFVQELPKRADASRGGQARPRDWIRQRLYDKLYDVATDEQGPVHGLQLREDLSDGVGQHMCIELAERGFVHAMGTSRSAHTCM